VSEPRRTVLVVDDSQSTVTALSKLLSDAGLCALTAADGASALKVAAAQPLDAVMLDVGLPGMDGLQVLRVLRASHGPKHLPVMMLSVRDDRQQRLTAFKLGADDFVRKPWDDEELVARLLRHLQVRARVDELLDEATALHRLSVTDGLTLLHNHRAFQERLREEFRRAQRHDDPLALVLLDLDHFKAVNDRHGHPAGDTVLREVAAVLRRCVRETDFLARYGGEEFGAILPNTAPAGAVKVAERIWRELGGLRTGPGGLVRITGSLGVSGFPQRGVNTSEHLLTTADEALYRAKREGRDRLCLYQPAPPSAAKVV
jgi:two-component system, cell cycle response regulator